MPVELVRRTFAAPAVALPDAAAEANHRIANNLAMIAGLARMHGQRIKDAPQQLDSDAVRFPLEEIGNCIEAVGRLHGLLARAEHDGAIDVAAYLSELSDAVIGSIACAAKARLTYHSTGTSLVAPERALPLGLIIVEMITNAVKYAHPAGLTAQIAVTCASINGSIMVEVTDDGVGLPEGLDPAISGGFGLRLMRSLADQINAELIFEDTGIGLAVSVRVPAS